MAIKDALLKISIFVQDAPSNPSITNVEVEPELIPTLFIQKDNCDAAFPVGSTSVIIISLVVSKLNDGEASP